MPQSESAQERELRESLVERHRSYIYHDDAPSRVTEALLDCGYAAHELKKKLDDSEYVVMIDVRIVETPE